MSRRYLLVECTDVVGAAVATRLAAEVAAQPGCFHAVQPAGTESPDGIIVHHPAEGNRCSGADIRRLAAEAGPFDVIVFGAPPVDESGMLPAVGEPDDDLVGRIDEEAKRSLALLQAALTVSLDRDAPQIWCLGLDDAFGYYLDGLGIAPIITQARTACLRTLVREYARMGIRMNAAIFQPPGSAVSAEALKAGRKDLKSYSLRHKPVTADAQADSLAALMAVPVLALNGSAVHLGTGVNEFNL